MVLLVASMLWARRGQALALGLLALFAVALPVAVPGYLQAVDRAAVATEVANAAPDEQGLSLSLPVDGRRSFDGLDFTAVGAALIRLDGFQEAAATEFPTVGVDPDNRHSSRLTYRQDVCAHLRVIAGRCLMAEGEIVLGERTAARLKITPGTPLTMTFAQLNPDPNRPVFLPAGLPKRMTVVGVYQVPDPDELYWGRRGYFTQGEKEPVFTGYASVLAMDHGQSVQSVDAWAGPGTFAPERLDSLPGEIAAARDRARQPGAQLTFTTSIPDLLKRIHDARPRAGQVVFVTAIPLDLLA
jgi:putative ABC transport system permease protein